MTQREKFKIKIDIKTFGIIFSTVASISFRGANIINKIETINVAQAKQQEIIESLIVNRDYDHKIIDQKLARLEPTVNLIIRKLGL